MSLETGTQLDELYYLVSARVQGMADAENEIGKFTSFLEGHPLAVAGAFGVALLGIGEKATTMAAQVDASNRTIANAIPGATGALSQLRDMVDQVAASSGRLHDEIQSTGEAIARNGVTSLEEYQARLQLVTEAGDAMGGALPEIASGLSDLQREFHLTDDQLTQATADLYALTQGKIPLDDLLSALVRAAPGVHDLGLDFNTAAAAMAGLINSGMVGDTRQAASAIIQYAQNGQAGKDALLALARQAPSTANAMRGFTAAASNAEQGAQRMSNRLRNDLDRSMVDLGSELLPIKAGLALIGDLLLSMAEHPFTSGQDDLKRIFGTVTDAAPGVSDTAKAVTDLAHAIGLLPTAAPSWLSPTITTALGVKPSAPPTPPTSLAAAPIQSGEQLREAAEAAQKLADLKAQLADATQSANAFVTGIQTQAIAALGKLADTAAAQWADLNQQLAEKEQALKALIQKEVDDAGKIDADARAKAKADGEQQLADFQQYVQQIRLAALAATKPIAVQTDQAPLAPDQLAPQPTEELVGDYTNTDPTDQLSQQYEITMKIVDKTVTLKSLTADLSGTLAQINEEQQNRNQQIDDQVRKEHEAVATQQQMVEALVGAGEAAIDLLHSSGGISDNLASALSGAVQLGGALSTASTVFGKLGQVDVKGNPLVTTPQAISAFGGVLSAVGAVASAIQSLGDEKEQAIEAAAAFKKAQEDWAATLQQFVDATNGAVTDLQKSLDDLTSQTRQLKDQAASDYGITGATAERLTTASPEELQSELNKVNAELASDLTGQTRDFLTHIRDLILALQQVDGASTKAATAIEQQFIKSLHDAYTASLPGGNNLTTLQGYSDAFRSAMDQLKQELESGAISATDFASDSAEASATFSNNWHTFLAGLSLSDLQTILPQLTGDQYAYAQSLIDTDEQLQTYTTGLQNLTDGFSVFGADAIGQASSYLSYLAKNSPQIANLLSGFDLSTQSGLQGADDALKQFFADVTDGKITFDDSTVSWQDVLTAIGYTNSGLQEFTDSANAAAAAAQNLSDVNDQAASDLAVRAAQDSGDPVAAKIAEDDAERAAAVKAEWTDANLAQLDYLHGQEELAAQQQANAAAAQQEAQDEADAAEQAAEASQQYTQAMNQQADSALAMVKNQMQLFGITDPVQQLQETLGALSEVAPIFQQLVGSLDVSTPEGRSGLLSNLQSFFLQNPGGVASGLSSADQVAQDVLNVAQLIQSAGTSATTTDSGTNSSFAIDQSITSAQGDRIGGLLTAMLAVDNEQLTALQAIATAVGATYTPVTPPALPNTSSTASSIAALAASGSSDSNGTTIVQLVFNGQTLDPTTTLPAGTLADARRLGQQIAKAVRRQQAGAL